MDATTGVAAAYAAMLGLMERDQTGGGQLIEFSQVEHLIQQIGGPLMDAVMNNRAQTPLGNRDPVRAPQGVYRCKDEDRSDDRWIVLTVGADDEWTGLCTAIGRPELIEDPRFEDMFVRSANHDELDKIIEEWSTQQDPRLAAELLQQHGVPAGMVAQDFDVLEDPHLDARGFFHQIDHPEAGRHRYPGHTYRLSKTPLRFDSPAPLLGEQNDYVYRGLLGFGEADIQRLTETGHIGTAYADHVR
jgi:crotonobetainyl-CoA:carnitine CoA-transferase CaiB-like acyl-CoA transferase